MRLGARTPYRNPASDIWHAGRVVGVRRTPNAADGRSFVRLEFPDGCELGEVEVIGAVLDLLRQARAPGRSQLCAACFPSRGDAVDRALSPDAARDVESWREALERQGDHLWFCPDCRSHVVSLTALCPNCGGQLEDAPVRRDRDEDRDEAVL